MERNYWQLGRWRRIPVAMHWTVLLACAWMYLVFWDVLSTLIASAALCVLLVVHVFGHVAVLRRQKVGVFAIRLYGAHGEVEHGYTSRAQAIAVAWGGVAAQLVPLALALAAIYLAPPLANPILATVLAPVLLVFTKVNVFLILLALLPIGPFDGHDAWAAIPWLRTRVRQRKARRAARRRKLREEQLFPEESLTPEQREELEAISAQAAAEVIREIARKAKDRQGNA